MTALEDLAQWRTRVNCNFHSHWRAKAYGAMYKVVVDNTDTATRTLSVDQVAELMEKVDAAYPFGERKHHPYKAWLTERALLIAALDCATATTEEWAAYEVAIDLVEMGRLDEAQVLLDAQAPNRHARPCPVCGERKGNPCREPKVDGIGGSPWWTKWQTRTLPHEARVRPKETS